MPKNACISCGKTCRFANDADAVNWTKRVLQMYPDAVVSQVHSKCLGSWLPACKPSPRRVKVCSGGSLFVVQKSEGEILASKTDTDGILVRPGGDDLVRRVEERSEVQDGNGSDGVCDISPAQPALVRDGGLLCGMGAGRSGWHGGHLEEVVEGMGSSCILRCGVSSTTDVSQRLLFKAIAVALDEYRWSTEKSISHDDMLRLCGEFGCPHGMEPSISLQDYVTQRLAKYWFGTGPEQEPAEPAVFIVALCLLDRLLNTGGIAFTRRTAHRLFSTALVLASKMQEEYAFQNVYYARVSGLASVADMNALECAFLNRIQFNVFVDAYQYKRMEAPLLTIARTMKEQEEALVV